MTTRTRTARRAALALACAVALLPLSPAQATTVPAPPPGIEVEALLLDVGRTHRLTASGPVGADAQLYAATAPDRTPRLIRTGTLVEAGGGAAGGEVSWELQPGGTTTYSVVVDGERSPDVTVQVRRTVTVGVRQADGSYAFSGRVDRPQAGVQVTIARLDAVSRRITGVSSTRTTADGRYEVRTSLPAGQAGYYALTSATPDLLAGRSRLYGLVVNARPAPVQTLSLDVGRGPGHYVFSGALRPGRSVPVTLARVVGGRLVGVAGGRTAASGGYVLRVPVSPGTHFFQVVTATARSRVYGLVVPQPAVPACSARSVRRSHDDSAQCMFRAYRRGDWAAVANYALPPVIALLRQGYAYDVEHGFNWSYFGCGEPEYGDLGDFPPASSGVACQFYSNANPGEVHGVLIEFNMDRFFRAESYSTVG